MIEWVMEFVQAIMTAIAGVMIFVILRSVDKLFRLIDWWTRRDKKPDKPSDAL
jgi:hypothetical protein